MEITPCDEQSDIMVDALGRDLNGQLVFLSLYGRDGSVQQFMSRMQLVQHADSVQKISLSLAGRGNRFEALVGDPRRLQKVTCRLPKQCLFGPLVHAWIFDPALTTPDRVNGRGWLTFDAGHAPAARDQAAWALIKQLSTVPLLDDWKDAILALLKQLKSGGDESPRCLSSAPTIGPIDLMVVQLPSHFESLISTSLREGVLTAPAAA